MFDQREQDARISRKQLVEYTLGTLLIPPDERDYFWGYVSKIGDRDAEITGPKGPVTFNLDGHHNLEEYNIVLVFPKERRFYTFPTKYSP